MSAHARFFCNKPYVVDGRQGSTASVQVSPGHYGRSIGVAIELAEDLRVKLRTAGIKFTDKGNNSAEMEIGNTNWDKSVMRVTLQIQMELPPEEALAALKAANFHEGFDFRY